jgi:hypothetical protein
MRVRRPRRYIPPGVFILLRPMLRHSMVRDAYVLRVIGGRYGPVLRVERRGRKLSFEGTDRRRRRPAM